MLEVLIPQPRRIRAFSQVRLRRRNETPEEHNMLLSLAFPGIRPSESSGVRNNNAVLQGLRCNPEGTVLQISADFGIRIP